MPLTQAQALYISRVRLGCRYDAPNNRVGYAFLDIEGDGENGGVQPPPWENWLQNPNQPAYEPRWHDRLWNTCGHIIAFNPVGNVLLITKVQPVNERRHFDYPPARGDGYTFRRQHLVAVNSETVATIPFGGNVEQEVGVTQQAVEQLYNAVLEQLKKLAADK